MGWRHSKIKEMHCGLHKFHCFTLPSCANSVALGNFPELGDFVVVVTGRAQGICCELPTTKHWGQNRAPEGELQYWEE